MLVASLSAVSLAVLVLRKKKYKMACDIYSFSVTMLECIGWCEAYPYDMKSWTIAENVCKGIRPNKPKLMKDEIISIC